MINVGLNSLTAIKVGSDTISKAYQGSTLIYDTTQPTYQYLTTRYNIFNTGSTKVANVIQEGVTTMKVDGVEVPASTAYTFTSEGSHTIEWVGVSQSIPAYGFSDIIYLYEAILPSGMTTIGGSAFLGTLLQYIELPDGLTTIENHCFADTNMQSIDIPSSVTYMGNSCLYSIYDVTFLSATPPQKDGDIFTIDVEPAVVEIIYVPTGSKSAYDAWLPDYTSLIVEM